MPNLGKILELLTHPTELRAVINYKIWSDPRDITSAENLPFTGYDRPEMKRCWELLDATSRSFARVIKELEGDLARVVAIFYLVLRALDTVEDDMTLDNSVKLPLLRSLHLKLHEPGWNFDGSGPNEADRAVLVEFNKIQVEFARLDEKYQHVIQDICQKMGCGMADFAALSTPAAPVAEVDSIADYDLYCHYVAGLVGEGLSGLFASSGKEREWLAEQLTLSNSMGLLLQKTNILRDIKEDVDEGRGFWPRAIWAKHGFASMRELTDPAREKEALWAASEMTVDALRHAVDALDYMTLLKTQSVFNFVAIPAAMAIATLDRCFMNPALLKRNVKIRKGEALQIMNRSVNPRDVGLLFQEHARSIHKKVHKEDPNLLKLSIVCARIEQWTEHHYPSFLQLSSPGAGFSIDSTTTDARAPMYAKMMAAAADKVAAEKKRAMMQDLIDRGIIRDPNAPKEYEEVEEDDGEGGKRMVKREKNPYPPPMPQQDEISLWGVAGVIGGILALLLAIAGGIIWLVYKYSD